MHVVRWLMSVLLVGALAAPAGAQAAAPSERGAQGTGAGNAVAPLRRPVTLALHDVPLVEAIQAIDQQADLRLAYTDRLPHLDRHVSITVTGMPAAEALARVLEGTGIVVRVTERGQITLVRQERRASAAARADSTVGELWGRVTDSVTAKPLQGAVVSVQGTALTATTNDSGYYWFNAVRVPAGVATLVARMIGYRALSRVTPVSATSAVRVDFPLAMSMSRLQEVVTTATGPRRRLEVGNDVTILNVDSIAATEPIRSVSDLLATRVPGLVALPTSGAPGDPIRLRLRGLHSALESNDPIVIVDGVRVYSDQSSTRAGNLAWRSKAGYAPAAPSPIDQIDPNSIETIEVMKGPSAATLYGSDAANGVIVITTKHGRAGPARWSASVDYGQTYLPGDYPAAYYRWGHLRSTHESMLCPLRDQQCSLDSLVRFQLLNDPRYSVLGHGSRRAITVGVNGGSAAITYNVTGSLSDETGMLTLPGYEIDRYRSIRGASPPGWVTHPQDYRTWSAATGLTMKLGKSATVGLNATIARGNQQRSTLETQLALLMRTYVDTVNGNYYEADRGGIQYRNALFGDFYHKGSDQQTTFTNGVTLNWRPLSWLTANADAGLNYIDRDDRMVMPRDVAPDGPDTVGAVSLGRGSSLMRTVNARATAIAPLPLGFRLQTSIGANYTATGISDFQIDGRDLAAGTTSLNDAAYVDAPSETQSDVATFGWYIEPEISGKRIWLSTGLRLDGGSTFGGQARLQAFPKISLSYLISDEPFFPFKKVFNTLRLRLAYGQSGVQPQPGDRLRLYQQQQVWYDSTIVTTTNVSTLGNTHIRPERAKDLEGGFDADLFGDRLSLGLTAFRDTRVDALMQVPVPPSVYGTDITYVLENIGVIRNTGLELTLQIEPVRTDLVEWSMGFSFSSDRNRVVSLAPGVSAFNTGDGRVAAGYPLFGRWARPIVGYQDTNQDGLIESNEVQVGDSAVYMGNPMPDYKLALSPHLSFFRGRIGVDANFTYEHGATQLNEMAFDNQIFSQALNDPHAPLGEQAAVAAMDRTTYGELQTLSTLRFNTLSISYALPTTMARRVGASALSLYVQGTNLGLFTNYKGKDPNVNAYASGNTIADTGVLPLPRTWQFRVSARY